MKLLIMICSHKLDIEWCNNIKILHDYMKLLNIDVEYCAISNQDDFHTYETIIPFKYRIINTKQQFSKICDFITDHKAELDYDWYMKIRPDIKLLEQIPFDVLSDNAINARARVYFGPKKIKYGMSINGEGYWKNIGDCAYSKIEHYVLLDDALFIFHKKVLHMGAFEKIEPFSGWWGTREVEWTQEKVFKDRNISLNVIGIHLELTNHHTFSGHVNM